jgi:hypothetical protein
MNEKAEKLPNELKTLSANYAAMNDEARKNLLLIADAFTRQYPNAHTPLKVLPVKWRPKLLKFLAFR